MTKSRLLPLCLAIASTVGIGLAQTAHAELHLEIAKAFDEAPQIAVVPFAADNQIYSIIQADLQRSGKFNSSSNNLPEQPHSTSEMNPAAWKNANIPYVVVGKVNPGGLVQYELYDVQKGTRLLGEQMQVPAGRQREAAHLIADKIYQAITGVPGDFSGQIAYVLRDQINGKPHYTL